MAIIDPSGLFNGDRLRRCSNLAQLHFPRLFLASDGYARIEINFARILGRAYPTFNPLPTQEELQTTLEEFAKNHLLFLYQAEGQIWGQWDTNPKFLPKYKTSSDRRSPQPPENAYQQWKRRYREECKAFQKSFQSISEAFLHGVGIGVGIGVGKYICASDDARVGELPSIHNPPFESLPESKEPAPETSPETPKSSKPPKPRRTPKMPSAVDQARFDQFWDQYWVLKAKKEALQAFLKHVRTAERFDQVMAAVRSQKPEMMERPLDKRKQAAGWLNGERWNDESPATIPLQVANSNGTAPSGPQQNLSRYVAR